MKLELGKDFPSYFQPAYPEEFSLFSHFETATCIPSPLFAITTWKPDGNPNICLHAWSCFHGDPSAFYAVLGNIYQHTHTFANIRREGCFCLNFLPLRDYDRLVATIAHNEGDEFAVAGLTCAQAKTIHAPAIEEAFLILECTLRDVQDYSGRGQAATVVGQVQHVSVEESYAQGYEKRFGKDGFPLLIPAPQDLRSGAPGRSALATLSIERLD